MKAETVRRSSQEGAPLRLHDEPSEDKIAHRGEPRELKPVAERDRRDSRWDEHRRERRRQLVDATLAAVSKHGAGVGMDEIAAEAGTSKTVVYRHFADRADLHVAVCSRVASQLLPKLRAAIESGKEPQAMVAAAIDAYLAFIEADPQLYRFVVHQQSPDRANGLDPVNTLSDLVGEQAAAAVSTALEQDGRDRRAAAPWGHGVVGMVRAAADWWLRAEQPMLRSELAAHLTDLAWNGLSAIGATRQHATRQEEL